MRSTRVLGLVLLCSIAAVGCSSSTIGGTGGTTGATGGSGGSATGGAGGGSGGACAACANADRATQCPTDVATASMCPSVGATCCDGNDQQWQCGLCEAETCHWIHTCTSTGTGGSGGSGGAGGTSGATDCNPACGAGSVCVGSGIEGGAVFLADAGMCPQGRHLQGNTCVQDLSYACMPLPSGCSGTVSCSCAASLCAALHSCSVQGPGEITCIEAVP